MKRTEKSSTCINSSRTSLFLRLGALAWQRVCVLCLFVSNAEQPLWYLGVIQDEAHGLGPPLQVVFGVGGEGGGTVLRGTVADLWVTQKASYEQEQHFTPKLPEVIIYARYLFSVGIKSRGECFMWSRFLLRRMFSLFRTDVHSCFVTFYGVEMIFYHQEFHKNTIKYDI